MHRSSSRWTLNAPARRRLTFTVVCKASWAQLAGPTRNSMNCVQSVDSCKSVQACMCKLVMCPAH